MRHDRIITNKATARKLSASSPTCTTFTVPLDEHWQVYAVRFQSLGTPSMTANVLNGPVLSDADLNAWPTNTGFRANILHTTTVDQGATGDWYAQENPRLYFPPGSIFHVVTEYVGTNPGSDWVWAARFVATAEPLTNW